MNLSDLIQLQIWVLLFVLVLCALWETLAPQKSFTRPRDRLAHVARNLAFGAVSILIASVLIGNAGLWMSLWVYDQGIGMLSMVPLPLWVLIPVGLLLADLSDYVFHRFCHQWRPLWLMHSVHHSDKRLDMSTSLRTHPGQTLAAVAWRMLVALAVGIPIWIVFARDVLGLAINVLHHANVSWGERIDAPLRWLIVTPAMHKVHHSLEAANNNANFGGLLSMWDRVFGTYVEPDAQAPAGYGLRGLAATRDQSMWGMLITPWRARRYGPL